MARRSEELPDIATQYEWPVPVAADQLRLGCGDDPARTAAARTKSGWPGGGSASCPATMGGPAWSTRSLGSSGVPPGGFRLHGRSSNGGMARLSCPRRCAPRARTPEGYACAESVMPKDCIIDVILEACVPPSVSTTMWQQLRSASAERSTSASAKLSTDSLAPASDWVVQGGDPSGSAPPTWGFGSTYRTWQTRSNCLMARSIRR